MKKLSLTKSFFFLAIGETVFGISGYITNAGLGRILGVAEYGRYSIVIGFTTMLIILTGRGIPTAMAKRISEKRDDLPRAIAIKKTAGFLQTIVIVVVTTLFYLFTPWIARVFGDTTLIPLFRIATFIIPAFALSSFYVLYFNGLRSFRAMTLMKASRGIFRMLWIVGLAYYYFSSGALWGAIAAPLSVFVIALILEYFIIKKPSKEILKRSRIYPWQKILSYGGTFLFFLLFYEFYMRTDLYLIKILTDSDHLTGLYSAAMTVAMIPYFILFALTFVLFPTISNLTARGEHEKMRAMIKKVLRFLFVALTVLGIFIALSAPLLVPLVFGSAFTDAALFVPLLIGGTVFGTIFYTLASIFNGAGYVRITIVITAIALIASIVLNMHFLPLYGITATAIIFSCTSTFMGLTALFFTWWKFIRVSTTSRH